MKCNTFSGGQQRGSTHVLEPDDVAKVYEANEEDPDSNSRIERQPPRQLAQTRLAGERRILASLNENLKQQWGYLNAARHLDFFGRKIRQAAERSERTFRATIQAFIAESNPAILGKKAQGKLAKGAPLLKYGTTTSQARSS